MPIPIIDFHCDLLLYLATDPRRSPHDAVARCSLPHLKKGRVQQQILAVYTESNPGSATLGWQQIQQFIRLCRENPDWCFAARQKKDSEQAPISLLLAIENASALVEEDEKLSLFFERWLHIEKEIGKIAYVSLTWNTENRFGGGAHTQIGLKKEGLALLEFLHQRRVAVDLSHTSDVLAKDILQAIEKYQLKIPIIASHSNARAVTNHVRNLPDDLIAAIIEHQGVIGMNFYRDFVGSVHPKSFLDHYQHIVSLGGESSQVIGADFFYGGDLPPAYRKADEALFFSEYGDASCYPEWLLFLQRELGLKKEALEAIAFRNAANFLERAIL